MFYKILPIFPNHLSLFLFIGFSRARLPSSRRADGACPSTMISVRDAHTLRRMKVSWSCITPKVGCAAIGIGHFGQYLHWFECVDLCMQFGHSVQWTLFHGGHFGLAGAPAYWWVSELCNTVFSRSPFRIVFIKPEPRHVGQPHNITEFWDCQTRNLGKSLFSLVLLVDCLLHLVHCDKLL